MPWALYIAAQHVASQFPHRVVDFADPLGRLPQGLVTEGRWSEGESRATCLGTGRHGLVRSPAGHLRANLPRHHLKRWVDSRSHGSGEQWGRPLIDGPLAAQRWWGAARGDRSPSCTRRSFSAGAKALERGRCTLLWRRSPAEPAIELTPGGLDLRSRRPWLRRWCLRGGGSSWLCSAKRRRAAIWCLERARGKAF